MNFTELDKLGAEEGLDQSSLKNDYLRFYQEYFSKKDVDRIFIIGDSSIAYRMAVLFSNYYNKKEIFFLTTKDYIDAKYLKIIHYKNIKDLVFKISVFNGLDCVIDHSENIFSNKNEHFFSIFPFLKNDSDYFIEDIHACFMNKFKDEDKSIYDHLLNINKFKLTGEDYPRIKFYPELISSIEIQGKLIKVKRSSISIFLRLQGLDLKEYNLINPILSKKKIFNNSYNFKSKCILNTNRKSFRDFMPNDIVVPNDEFNYYKDVVCCPGQILFKDGVLLPEHQRRTIKNGHINKNIKFTSNYFVYHDVKYSKFLKGNYLYLDSEYDDHFGHIVVEQVSKFWAIQHFFQEFPDGKILLGSIKGKINNIMLDLLLTYGVSKSNIVIFSEATFVENLICPSQQYQIGYYSNLKLKNTWDVLKEKYIKKSNAELFKKIFIGRSANISRGCNNYKVVEKIFTDAGYKIIYPENYDFCDQVYIFANADFIAGYGGSGTLNSIFSNDDVTRTIIKSDSYDANNDYLISSIKGGVLNICFCDAEIKHDNSWSVKAFMSNYTFNENDDREFLINCI